MVTGHRLVDGLIQEYWGLFIKWDTAMYQVGTECFVPRSFHSHVSLKVGGIWWFAMDPWISTSFHRVSTEIPMDFHIRIRNSCFSFSHQPGRVAEIPMVRLPVVQGTSHRWAISSPIQLPVIQKMLPFPVFQLHLWSFFTVIWCHMMSYDPKKISNPQDSEIGIPFFKQPRQFLVRSRGVNSKRRVVDHWTQYQLCAGPGGPIICISYICINITKILYMECYYTNDVYHHIR